ncbi:MAG: hypothetical protein ACI9WU_001823 [Myxococcota bacterium]
MVHPFGPAESLAVGTDGVLTQEGVLELRRANPWVLEPDRPGRSAGNATAVTVGPQDTVHIVHTIADTGDVTDRATGVAPDGSGMPTALPTAIPSEAGSSDSSGEREPFGNPVETGVTTVRDGRYSAELGLRDHLGSRPGNDAAADAGGCAAVRHQSAPHDGSGLCDWGRIRQRDGIGYAPRSGRRAGCRDVASRDRLLARRPLRLQAARSVPYAKDPASAVVQRGRRLFTFVGNPDVSSQARFACATCHIDGAEDKRVWIVDEGPRQTPSLANRLADTEPFNWSGQHSGLEFAVADAVSRMQGEGLTQGELDDLAAFLLNGIEEPVNPHAGSELTPEEELGRSLFEDPAVGCAGYHSDGVGTDGKQWSVGTMAPGDQVAELNTPSPRGL